MAHEIDLSNGKANIAFTGSRDAIWHGLGQELQVGAPIEVWKKQAGMDWEAFESAVSYQTVKGSHIYPDRKAIFRSDNQAALSIVGQDFKIVQPGEVLDFFKELVERHGMVLSTAGCLFGGKRFWALADTGKAVNIGDKDKVVGHLLLTTAVDGTMATTAKFVAERVVCNNTLTVAMSESGRNMIKRTHKVDFDPQDVKIDLGILDAGWNTFIGNLQKLSETKMDTAAAQDFFQKMFFKKDVLAQDQSWGVTRKVTEMVNLFNSGVGADMSRNTAWGALNAITEGFTHGSGKRDPSHQFWESYYGLNDNVKTKAYNALVAA